MIYGQSRYVSEPRAFKETAIMIIRLKAIKRNAIILWNTTEGLHHFFCTI